MKPRMLKLATILLATALAAPVAVAATSGTVTLGGTVASTLAITVSATGAASALDLDGDGSASAHVVQVADLAIATNNETGFTLTATSGSLTKTGGTSIAYQVTSVNDAAPAPLALAFTVASGSNYTVATSTSGAGNKDLYILYTPLALQDPGTYAGSITLTVSDN